VAELNSGTGVPARFTIEAIFPSICPERHERQIHERLADSRLESKEFFRTDLEEALRCIEEVCGKSPFSKGAFGGASDPQKTDPREYSQE
jgi:hypothetical protein